MLHWQAGAPPSPRSRRCASCSRYVSLQLSRTVLRWKCTRHECLQPLPPVLPLSEWYRVLCRRRYPRACSRQNATESNDHSALVQRVKVKIGKVWVRVGAAQFQCRRLVERPGYRASRLVSDQFAPQRQTSREQPMTDDPPCDAWITSKNRAAQCSKARAGASPVSRSRASPGALNLSEAGEKYRRLGNAACDYQQASAVQLLPVVSVITPKPSDISPGSTASGRLQIGRAKAPWTRLKTDHLKRYREPGDQPAWMGPPERRFSPNAFKLCSSKWMAAVSPHCEYSHPFRTASR